MLNNTGWIQAHHPSEIYHEMDQSLEGDWPTWDPDTFIQMFPALDGTMALDKLLAVQAIARDSTRVCTLSAMFEKIVHVFCNQPMIADVYQPPEICEIVYAVEQISSIVKSVHLVDVVFNGEVPGYVAAVAKFRKMLILPESLSFAQSLLDFLQGITVGSKRGMELEAHLAEARSIAAMLSLVDYTKEDLNVLDDLEKNHGPDQLQTMRTLIGCYLYNPTKG